MYGNYSLKKEKILYFNIVKLLAKYYNQLYIIW